MVRNYMETLVDEHLSEILKTDARFADVCTCDKCLDDMRACALNHIHPFYITGKRGQIYGQYHTMATQNMADIMTEIIKAIETVSRNKHINE